MSKTNLRRETDCLNCENEVTARYCSHCGQENREPYESFWSLVIHFIEDITHFDGAFFRTFKTLIFSPGSLTQAYLAGKRSSYLHPIRFYLFTSAFFFLTLFYVFQPLQFRLNKNSKAIEVVSFEVKIDKRDAYLNSNELQSYRTNQAKLSETERDSPFFQNIIVHFFELQKKYPDSQQFYKALYDGVSHKMSQVLFITIPLLALILQVVFLRRKHFYFMHHGIFVLHMATSLFVVLFMRNVLDIIQLGLSWKFMDVLKTCLMLIWGYFYYQSFKNFYALKGVKSVLFFTVSILFQFLLFLIVFINLVLFSFFSL
ncbi:DUF3667 domain-containing protein [Cytophagaceae bacterium 50C-KIRBA]|uniref:DUF3667 domain-containing protein n=1 Tax=Aquirufa beregesia TaxID=2516556 RepID=A0ABX0ESY7_9BACT|nr:DUF3667 domain-containing protein [Aquirufa beregesia]NGZ43569.1 DUF3667 domain-containing protein [Aquirufa beregesia]